MKWPNHTDYQDALQDPLHCFAEEDLKQGEPACDMLGLPRVMSGNFASVYELAAGGKRWAIRCFVRQVAGTQARYARLSEHLEAVHLPWLVGFDYILKGILVHGEWYPIVRMDWVEGVPINNYIEEHLSEPDKLRDLATQFRTLVRDLRQHKIAHGDFQHGNIMVTPEGQLRLVDYDGMYCPAFGKKRSPELGHVNFQHPLRLADYYDESLDNFSSLIIYTSLLALADDPGLWNEFYTGDNLILGSSDYRNVHASKAFQRFAANPNPQVPQLSTLIQKCCMSPVAFVPWFEETLAALEQGNLQESMALLPEDDSQAAPPAGQAAADGPPQGGPGAADWWENSQARTAIGTRRAPLGSRPAEAAAAMAGGTRPAPVPEPAPQSQAPLGSRPAPSGGTRPAPSGTRPAPVGSRPAPAAVEEPASSYVPRPVEEPEGGLSTTVKIAIAAMVLLIILCIAVSVARSRSGTPPAAAQSP